MNIPIYKFSIFDDCEDLIHGLSMKKGGVSEGVFESLNLGLDVGDKATNVEENFKRFCGKLNVDIEKLCVAFQDHTDNVVKINEGVGLAHPFEQTDGFITNVPGIPLMVRFADCQGVFFYDPVKKAIGAVHSGWRGNVKNIIGIAVEKMVTEYGCDPVNILAAVAPSLGPCCAEFTDPFTELPEEMHKYISGKHVDLWECAFDQLKNSGVLAKNIEMARECTVCNKDKYFSFRGGNKKTGHMGGIIQLA